MKTRILSLVLALIMVVSLTAVFAVSSSAEAEPELTVTVGTAYAAPGTTALVEVFVSAKGFSEDYYLRNWQFTFEGLALSGKDDVEAYVSGGGAFFTENPDGNFILNSSDSGQNCGTFEELAKFGGFKIATIGFTVPADAEVGTEIALNITKVTGLAMESATNETIDGGKDACTVNIAAGKVVVVSGTGVAGTYVAEGEDYVIPSVNDNGERVTALGGEYDGNDDFVSYVSGEYGILTIPASIVSFETEDGDNALEGIDGVEGIVLKNAEADSSLIKSIVDTFGSSAKPPFYYHKSVQGEGISFTNAQKKKVTPINLLQVYAEAIPTETGVAFVAGIATKDGDYEGELVLSIKIGEKTWEYKTKKVCYTLRGLATSKEEVAASTDLAYTEGITYLLGAKLNGIPAGDYTAEVTLYALTADALGSAIGVCSETATIEFTVG